VSDETAQPEPQEPTEIEAAAVEETPAAEATPEAPAAQAAAPEAEDAPAERVKPEIPGADLVPDIVPEGETAIAADETEVDTYAADDSDSDSEADAAPVAVEEVDVKPIAGATIDLAKDARYDATGKRKSAVARVTLKPGTGEYSINGRTLEDMFPRITLQRNIRQPLETVGYEDKMDVVCLIHGGGVSAQADALRHGISRALVKADPNLRGELKKRGFLTRDPRVVERKKAGLKKARKRPQFSKR